MVFQVSSNPNRARIVSLHQGEEIQQSVALDTYTVSFSTTKRTAFGMFNIFTHFFFKSYLKPDGIIKIKEAPLRTSRDAISMLMARCFLKEEIKDIKGVRRINRSFVFQCRIQHRNDQ